jgi:hypothetical protein
MTKKNLVLAIMLIALVTVAGNFTTDNLQVNQVATLTQTKTPMCYTGIFATDGPRIDNWDPACLVTNSVIGGQAGDNEGTLLTGIAAVTHGPATTIAVASNGQSLPQATINVASTTGFSSVTSLAGTVYTVYVTTGAGQQTVACTGVTSTTFTGCTGGSGAMSTGGAVSGGFDVGTIRTICDINGTADAGIISLSLDDANSIANNRIRNGVQQGGAALEDRLIIDTGQCMTLIYSAPVQADTTIRRWMPSGVTTRSSRLKLQNFEMWPFALPAAITGTQNDYNPTACASPIGGSCLNSGSTSFVDYSWATLTTSNASTTIAAGSNGAVLPQATINVASTATFNATSHIYINVVTSTGTSYVTCTGTSGGTSFTGCSGGSGTMSTGGAVTSIEVLTGMAGPGGNGGKGQGTIKVLSNAGPAPITITAGDADSVAGNRFSLPNSLPIVLYVGDARMFWTNGGGWVVVGTPLSLNGNTTSAQNHLVKGSSRSPVSANNLEFSNVTDQGTQTQIGAFVAQDSTTQNSTQFVTITPSGSNIAAQGQTNLNITDSRSFDCTASVRSTNGLAVVTQGTRSAGANGLTNIAIIADGQSGQTNYAWQSVGSEYHGLGAQSTFDYHNTLDFDASAAAEVETTFGVGGGAFTSTTRLLKCAQSGLPTVNHGTLSADAGNCMGRITAIGSNTSVTLTYSSAFGVTSHCQVTATSAPGGGVGELVYTTVSASAPVFNCLDSTTGAAANCPDLEYMCWGR